MPTDSQEPEERYADLTNDERTEQMARLRAEHAAHPGTIAFRSWTELARSQAVVTANAIELLAVLEAPNSDPMLAMELVQNVRPPQVRDQYFRLLDQRLHNLLASVVTLVDHRRRVVAAYEGTEFQREFLRRNATVTDLPESVFVRDFRNYLLHYSHAPVATSVNFNQTAITARLTLSTDALRRSGYEWKAGSKRLMEDAEAGLELEPVVRTYLSALDELNAWWAEQFETLHGGELDEANDLIRRINLTLTAGTSDGHDWQKRMAHIAENSARRDRGEPQTDYVAQPESEI